MRIRNSNLLALSLFILCLAAPPAVDHARAATHDSASNSTWIHDVQLHDGLTWSAQMSASYPGTVWNATLQRVYWVASKRPSTSSGSGRIDADPTYTAPSALQVRGGLDASGESATSFGQMDILSNRTHTHTISGPDNELGQSIVTTTCRMSASGAEQECDTGVQIHSMPTTCRFMREGRTVLAEWESREPLAAPLSHHGVVSVPTASVDSAMDKFASQLYVTGGMQDLGHWIAPYMSSQVFGLFRDKQDEPHHMQWHQIKDSWLPAQQRLRMSGSVAVHVSGARPVIFTLGGVGGEGVSAAVSVFHLSGNYGEEGTWEHLAKDMHLNHPRHSLGAAAWTDDASGVIRLYAVGGGGVDVDRDDLEMLTLGVNYQDKAVSFASNPQWQLAQGKLQIARYGASAVIVNDFMYVIGGEMALGGEVERCNITAGCAAFTWMQPLNLPRYSGSAVWSHDMNEILYIGGFRVGSRCGRDRECNMYDVGIRGDVESYHIETNSWNKRPGLQKPRYAFAATEVRLVDKDTKEMRHEILAIGGVGSDPWTADRPMEPVRISEVESFSCFFSCGGRLLPIRAGPFLFLLLLSILVNTMIS